MSAGVSNSTGTMNSTGTSSGTKTGTQGTTGTTDTAFNNTSTQQQHVPVWAQAMNKSLAQSNSAASGQGRDFLSGLLNDNYGGTSGGGGSGGQGTNRFSDAINNLFATQLAKARTGGAQQTGVARQGFREGAAVADAQHQAIGEGTGAATSLLQLADPNRQLDFARLSGPVTTTNHGTGTTTMGQQVKSSENSTGTQATNTQQTGSNSGYGLTLCCFIFLEATNGQLPWWVRRCRDEFATEARVLGYRTQAQILVPRMRKSKFTCWWVNTFMIRPMTKWGGWLYNEPGYSRGWVWFPFVAFWFNFWNKKN